MKPITLIDKAFLLKRSPLFGSLDLDLLLTIADKLNTATFDPNDVIFTHNEEANRMYFIVKGKVIIRSDNAEVINFLNEGDFFGEESLFNNKPRSYEAACLENTKLLTLSRTNLYTIISECPSVAVGFLQVYTSSMEFRPFKQQETEK
ncbi:MAG: cyclic nucleotide-binding domain-containing protein [Parachlamydiaceae bacterium]|nr:cyclic nucleotide-binding domain-containing protein [Parachlamydiaceae bacterium]